MSGAWRLIATAPRNKTPVYVTAEDAGTFIMCWDPEATNSLFQEGKGIWVAYPNKEFTWSEEKGMGPTHWKPCLQ